MTKQVRRSNAILRSLMMLTYVIGAAGIIYSIQVFCRKVIKPDHPHITRMVLAPDGQLLAFVRRNRYDHRTGSAVFIADLQHDGNHRRLVDYSDSVFNLAWSADQQLLAMGTSTGQVSVWQVNSPKQLWMNRVSTEQIWGLEFAGSNLILTTGQGCEPGCKGSLIVLDAKTGQKLSADESFENTPTSLAISLQNGRFYLGANYGSSIMERDLATGTLLRTKFWGFIEDLSVSSDGKFLAVLGNREFSIIDCESLEQLSRGVESENIRLWRVEFIPGRNEFITNGFSDKPELQRWSFGKSKMSMVQDYGDCGFDFAVSKDGTRLFHSTSEGFSSFDLRVDDKAQ